MPNTSNVLADFFLIVFVIFCFLSGVTLIIYAIVKFFKWIARASQTPHNPNPPIQQPRQYTYDTTDPFNRPPNYPQPPSRDQWVSQQRTLSPDECDMIEFFRASPPELQNYIFETLKREHAQRTGRR